MSRSLADNPQCWKCKSRMVYIGGVEGKDEPRHKYPSYDKYYCTKCQRMEHVNR